MDVLQAVGFVLDWLNAQGQRQQTLSWCSRLLVRCGFLVQTVQDWTSLSPY